MKAVVTFFAFAAICVSAAAAPSFELACAHAPSQSALVAGIAGGARGANVALISTLAVTGIRAVTHSSGAYILTGPSGYIGGTLGSAGVVPSVLVVTLLVGGALTAFELVCAPTNHPEQVAKVKALAQRFGERVAAASALAQDGVRRGQKLATVAASGAAVKSKRIAGNVFAYAKRSEEAMRKQISNRRLPWA